MKIILKSFKNSDIGKVCKANLAKHDFQLLEDFIREAIQNLKQELLYKIEKTKDESFAFMTMTDKEGKLLDWAIPKSEVVKIIQKI